MTSDDFRSFLDRIKVIDEAGLMAETGGTGEHVHIVIRVADATVVPYAALAARRFKVRCTDCHELCWFDPLSSPAPGLGRSVCLRCIGAHLQGEQQ